MPPPPNETLQYMQCDCEQLDPRGRTPLHLAVVLTKVRCVNVLLRHGANALAINRHNWTGECAIHVHAIMVVLGTAVLRAVQIACVYNALSVVVVFELCAIRHASLPPY